MEYPGAFYHITVRGIAQQAIFLLIMTVRTFLMFGALYQLHRLCILSHA